MKTAGRDGGDRKMKQVLLLGDSIRMQYQPVVGKKLADRFGLEPGVKSKFQRGLEVYTEAADRTGR